MTKNYILYTLTTWIGIFQVQTNPILNSPSFFNAVKCGEIGGEIQGISSDWCHPLPTANSCTLVGLFWALLWLQSFSGKKMRTSKWVHRLTKVRGENYKNMKPPTSNNMKQQSSGWCWKTPANCLVTHHQNKAWDSLTWTNLQLSASPSFGPDVETACPYLGWNAIGKHG